MQARGFDYAILALGVCAVSTAALLIREAAAPSLVIAAYRLALASLPLLALTTMQRRPLLGGGRQRILLTILAGVFLALHFVFWITSVKQTSIATSVFLVTTSPLFVALASGPLLGERPTRAMWLGIAIACLGGAVMVGDDLDAGGDTLMGDLYALLGAIFATGYYLVGRRLRTEGEGWLSYVTLAYSVSAVVLVALVLASGSALFDYSGRTFAFLGLLALVPQLIGHTALNRSLGYLPAVSVSMAVRGEPIGATILGVIFLNETPTALEIAGAVLVMAGLYVGFRAPATHSPASKTAWG
ncbi:MAG TPA: DMT family transporter [Dehalococcoidia bacterium]|nr:DMT family transporter [Dehalococcoidia bacterium]